METEVTIKTKDRELVVHGTRIWVPCDSIGVVCVGGNDLYDLGFRPEELEESGAVTLLCTGPVVINIENRRAETLKAMGVT